MATEYCPRHNVTYIVDPKIGGCPRCAGRGPRR